MVFKSTGSARQPGRRRLPSALLAAWLFASFCLAVAPGLAGEPLLKPDVPKLDTPTEAPAVAPGREAARRAPLKGAIEHSERLARALGPRGRLLRLVGRGHNDVWEEREVVLTIRELLQSAGSV